MWVPPEIKDPVLTHAPTRKSVACFGAVSLASGKFVRALCDRFDAATFEAFLKKLLRHRTRGKRMVVVLDNARYHHAVLLAPLLRRYRKVAHLAVPAALQPAACADRAHLEADRRLATHNRYFATLGEVLMAVEACFDQWRKPNSALRRLCGII